MKNWKLVGILLLLALLVIVPVYAQDATAEPAATEAVTPEALPATSEALVAPEGTTTPAEAVPIAGAADETTPENVPGATLLVLLLGVGAIAVVGGYMLLRENAKPASE